MKKSLTYKQLWLLEIELDSLKKEVTVVGVFLDDKIKKFLNNPGNIQTMRSMHRQFHAIQKKYIVHDAENNPVYADPVEGQKKEWKYVPFVEAPGRAEPLINEEVKKAYEEESNLFFQRSVKVEL